MKKLFFSVCFLTALQAFAQVRLPGIFSDNMVLQRNSTISIWGWSSPSEKIHLVASWKPLDTLKTKGDRHAQWKLELETPEGPGPYTIQIKGYNEIVIKNVLLGEVWLASGQSNMEWTPSQGLDGGEEQVKTTINKNIRFFKVPKQSAEFPQQNSEGSWVEANPDDANYFSAIAYFFGIKLNEELNVPVGLISSSWGGTPVETWMPPRAFEQDESLTAAATLLKKDPWCPSEPSRTFNAMINPLVPFKIAGVIWYQGETNTSNFEYYEHTFSTLINSWRTLWSSEFPFYYAQIAPYNYGDNFSGVAIRDTQRRVLALPNTGMVVTADIGNNTDIHPRNKLDVGLRFANLALEKHYKTRKTESESPLVKKVQQLNSKELAIYFDNASGLEYSKTDNTDDYFEIAGADKKFVKAKKFKIKEDYVVLKTNIKDAKYVRYGWSNQLTPGLSNAVGLPASSFSIEIEKE